MKMATMKSSSLVPVERGINKMLLVDDLVSFPVPSNHWDTTASAESDLIAKGIPNA